MEVHFTARRFKARDGIRSHAIDSVKKLDKFYDGIVRGDVVLSYERISQSIKMVEISLHVHGNILAAKEKSDDFYKSIDLAIEKLERQLAKYKTKARMKNKKTLRQLKEETIEPAAGDEE